MLLDSRHLLSIYVCLSESQNFRRCNSPASYSGENLVNPNPNLTLTLTLTFDIKGSVQ